MNSYPTTTKVDLENLLKDVPATVVDEVIARFEMVTAVKSALNKVSDNTEAFIRSEILKETDWRRKATLAAMLISRSLE